MRKYLVKNLFEIIFATSLLTACIALSIAAFSHHDLSEPPLPILLNIFAPSVIVASISGVMLLIKVWQKRVRGNIA